MRRSILLALTLAPTLLPTGADAQTSGVEVARAYREAHGPEIIRDFATLLAIPNNAGDSVGIRRNAEYIRSELERRGVTAELLELPGAPPIVYGELLVPGATRTLGIYIHYDGQPVDERRWTHGAWEPTLYTRLIQEGGQERPFPRDGEAVDPEWMIYARSAGDDKAPLGALLPVLAAFQEGGVTPTSNLIFFFEGDGVIKLENLKWSAIYFYNNCVSE